MRSRPVLDPVVYEFAYVRRTTYTCVPVPIDVGWAEKGRAAILTTTLKNCSIVATVYRVTFAVDIDVSYCIRRYVCRTCDYIMIRLGVYQLFDGDRYFFSQRAPLPAAGSSPSRKER